MANAIKPMGLVPIQHLNGSAYNGAGRIYSISPTYASMLRQGDPVTLSGAGDANGVPGITLAAAASGPILGAVLGIGKGPTMLANPSNPNSTIFPAGGDGTSGPWYALVEDSPDVLYSIMEPTQTTQFTAADIGLNSKLAAGSTSTFQSDWTLAAGDGSTTPETTSTLPVQLLGLVQTPGNSFGAGAQWLCRINVHQFAAGVAGV